MPAKREATLLPESENVNSFSSRLIHWVTTAGRFVIVFTELIVVGAFISRFWLDRQNSDLSEVLRQQKAILESTQDFEKQYSLLQQRLASIKKMYIQAPGYSEKLSSLADSAPPEILFNSLSISQDPVNKDVSVNLSLTALSEESMVKFINNLTLNPDIRSVNVKNIEKKPKENGYTLSVLLVFNKVPQKS